MEFEMARKLPRSASALLFTAVAAGTMAFVGAAFAADEIDVTIDFAKVMKLDKPAHTIILGNPGIADATVGDDKLLVLTGKTAGTTNLIVLDDTGAEILNAPIRVSSDIHQLTTVFFGQRRQTFSCAPVCEAVVSVGDDPNAFTNATAQIQTRKDFSAAQ
jgi:Flp pilus assembly secretin CpaC